MRTYPFDDMAVYYLICMPAVVCTDALETHLVVSRQYLPSIRATKMVSLCLSCQDASISVYHDSVRPVQVTFDRGSKCDLGPKPNSQAGLFRSPSMSFDAY